MDIIVRGICVVLTIVVIVAFCDNWKLFTASGGWQKIREMQMSMYSNIIKVGYVQQGFLKMTNKGPNLCNMEFKNEMIKYYKQGQYLMNLRG